MVMEELTLKINGMHDDFTVDAVESSIMSLDGVETGEIDSGIEIAKIMIDTNKISKKDIQEAAYEAGFSVEFQ